MKQNFLRYFIFCSLMFCFLANAKAQTPELSFDYDAAGNQTTRTWICINCTTPFASAAFFSKYMGTGTITAPPAPNKTEDRKLIAFPNPLTEILTLKWENQKYYIKAVEVSTISGTSVYSQSYPYVEGQTQVTVPFSKLIAGMYIVRVTHSDGKQEIVRVVKI